MSVNWGSDVGNAEGAGYLALGLVIVGLLAYVVYEVYETLGPNGVGGGLAQIPAALSDLYDDFIGNPIETATEDVGNAVAPAVSGNETLMNSGSPPEQAAGAFNMGSSL